MLAALVGLAVAPLAQGGTVSPRAVVTVGPTAYSPSVGALRIDATLNRRAPLGLQLVGPGGGTLGWLTREAPRLRIRLGWRGFLAGTPVRDGTYRVRAVSGGRLLTEAAFTLDRDAPKISDLHADDGGTPYAGDGPLLTTISPNGDGLRDRASVLFTLNEPATVVFAVSRTVKAALEPIFQERLSLLAGPNAIAWSPPADQGPRTYVTRLTLVDAAGNQRVIGRRSAGGGGTPGPIIRVQGVDAAFERASYGPGEEAVLDVATDAASFNLQLFRSGPETVYSRADNVMTGVPVGDPTTVDWSPYRNVPGTVSVPLGALASGVYYAELTAADGRIGYAPFVVRPAEPGASRIAIVMPTNTWQAYNFYDADGDGWGDTWYAGGALNTVQLGRPFLRRGVPPFFARYDLPFLRWLSIHGHTVDVLSDDELDAASPDALAAAYDLIVFPGHHEYITDGERAAVTGFRDRGGNLLFLSANNFFWRVTREGEVLTRTQQWRQLGMPEAALIGTQYRANDEGHKQAPFVVRDTTSTPWLWDGTGLQVGSTIGADIGGYGIEIDAASPASPPGTVVLAEVPDLLGPGLTAQMTYYETPAGAKVFAAGALDFGGSVNHQPQDQLLQNLWAQLTQP